MKAYRPKRIALLAALFAAAAHLSGCKAEGCLAGDESERCIVPSPCAKLSFDACGGGKADVHVIRRGEPVPGGLDALGAPGDVLLSNDKVSAVVAALDNPTNLAPGGGYLLDLGTAGGDDDNLNQMLQVVGILPGDTVRYTEMELFSNGTESAAVQFRGRLDGRPHVKVATRYEVRACEPGVRVRTEAVNLGFDPELWALSDGFAWNGRETLPFAAGTANEGFRHDSFDLLTIDGVWKTFPFAAWSGHSSQNASYGYVGCNVGTLDGFNSDRVSALGLPKTVVPTRGYQVYERFLAVTPGSDVAAGAGIALQIRKKLFGDKVGSLHGRVVRPGGVPTGGGEGHMAVAIAEGTKATPSEKRIPWSEVAPGDDGKWTASLPAGKHVVLTLWAYGRVVAEYEADTAEGDKDVGDLVAPLTGALDLQVIDAATGSPMDARVVLVPADESTRRSTTGKLFGQFVECAPLLGAPHGPSPACNQILVRGDAPRTVVEVPSGKYFVYATRGLFWTLARKVVDVGGSTVPLGFSLSKLPLLPAGTVSADLHVHGRASFDSSIPDLDRILAFSAAGMEIIAATDHDVVQNYASAIAALSLQDKVVVIPGTETTQLIPWFTLPGSVVPRVIGHYNFWPLQYQPDAPRKGSPDDELIEPGQLFERVDPLYSGSPVRELNHPWADAEFGRDLGFPRAVKLDATRPLDQNENGTGNNLLWHVPKGAHTRNDAYHAQEVMNGSRNSTHLSYRAFWFYLLNLGIVRAGTANSDSHGLTDDVIGTPRNVVWADTPPGRFDVEVFDDAIRRGRLMGTNGPVIDAVIRAPDGTTTPPSVSPVKPPPGSVLAVKVSAAPWVPVAEVRLVVNGLVVRVYTNMVTPDDPYGTGGLVRFDATVRLDDILPAGNKDAWIVVEAGEPLPLVGDINGDGIPDTTDNNGDGKVDFGDVAVGEDYGPMNDVPAPKDEGDIRFDFAKVSTDGVPQAFTNPFILDRDGGGFQGPGLPGGAK